MSKVKGIIRKFDFSDSMKSYMLKGRKSYAEWIILFCILAVSATVFLYMDILNTFDNSILFMKSIFSGNFLNFYDYTVQNAQTNYAANYEVLIYFIYGIWNLPVLLLSEVFGIDYLSSPWCCMWCKLLGVICSVLIGYVTYKILRYTGVNKEYSMLGFFLVMSSMALFMVAFIIAQVDEAGLLLIMLGFYYYLQGKNKKFILCFILAMPLKSFAIFIMIPLIALREKRFLFVIGKTALGVSLMVFFKLLFKGDAAYNFALSSQSQAATEQILKGTLNLGTSIVMFIAVYIAVCVFCFLHKVKEEDKFSAPIYISFLVWAAFFCTVPINTYWIIFLAPFSVLAVISSGKYMKVTVLLETLWGIGFSLYAGFKNNVLSEKGLVTRLFLPKFVDVPSRSQLKYGSLKNFAEALSLDRYIVVLNTVFVVCLIILLILTNPWLNKKAAKFEKVDRGVIWIRLGFMAAFSVLIILVNVLPDASVKYSTLEEKAHSSTVNLLELNKTNTVSQGVEFEKDAKLSQLTIKLDNKDSYRRNFTSVVFELVDETSGETVFSYREGCSMIDEKEENHTVKLKDTYVNSQDVYTLKIYGVKGVGGETGSKGIKGSMTDYEFYLYQTDKLVDKQHPAVVNGEKQDYNLCFEIK